MTQLFLTSSVSHVAHEIAKNFDLSEKNRLLFITTAADGEEGDKTWLKNDRQALVDAGFQVTDYTIVGKTTDVLREDLMNYDFIYMSGGNTLYLLEQSQKTGFIPIIQDLIRKVGKIFIGTSAGSIIAGPSVPDYLEADEGITVTDRTAYNFVNFTIVPHWGSEHFRERYLGRRLETAYRDDQVPLILLTDNQYVSVEGESFTIVDVSQGGK